MKKKRGIPPDYKVRVRPLDDSNFLRAQAALYLKAAEVLEKVQKGEPIDTTM